MAKKVASEKPRVVRSGKEGAQQAPPTAAEVNDAVMKANESVKTVFAAEDEWRLNLLKENETLSRETVDTEVDIRRLLDEQARLKESVEDLSKEQAKLGDQVKDLSGKVNGAEKERDLAKAKNADLKEDLEALEKTIHELTSENASLEKETKKLGTQRDKLDEDVKRLRKLREEYAKTIAKFKEEKDDLLA
jgi:chromosome segregation ATPase